MQLASEVTMTVNQQATYLIVETSVQENLHLQVFRWKDIVKAEHVPTHTKKVHRRTDYEVKSLLYKSVPASFESLQLHEALFNNLLQNIIRHMT